MGETNNNQQSGKSKVCKPAIVSPLLSILGIFLLVLVLYGFGIYGFIGQSWMPLYLRPLYVYGHLISALLGIAGIAAGIFAIKHVHNKRSILKGRWFAVSGLLLALAFLPFWLWHLPSNPFTARERCAANLRALGRCMLIYTSGDNPMPRDKWCDLLIECANTRKDMAAIKKFFRCPANKNGRCHYAINVSLDSNPHQVVLFETKPGWNRVGGPELLTTDNHNGKGCNVLFHTNTVEFVKTQDLANLLWNPGQINKRHLNITKAKLKIVHTAVMQFKLDTGRFPTEEEGLVALIKLPDDVKNIAEPGGYLETTQNLKDGWGNDFHYELYPESDRPFVIISYGADGKEGGEGYDADWPEGIRKPKDY